MLLVGWPWRPWDQSRAIENARAATTELCRRRVERDDVEAFLAGPEPRRAARARA